jgi:uncharacterized FAD-dependent dehydrogenase
MKKVNLILTPEQASSSEEINRIALQKAKFTKANVVVTKRSIDARRSPIKINLEALVGDDVDQDSVIDYRPSQNNVADKEPVIIIGSGPAGLFAALRLIELGVKPIILERGKDVQSRRKDIAKINRQGLVDSESNYCFGEGGAGTYSDGKLYTRSKKRGSVRKVLEILNFHGATEAILSEAHPHIGTNKLPKIIQSIREYIIEHGGEIHFESKVNDFIISDNEIKGVKTVNDTFKASAVILATGHSARDIYELLEKRDVFIEPKPFALGVRVEHPQGLIDSIQYHCDARGPYLPAAAYSLVSQVEYQKSTSGVFSFCMCPGGFIVPAATAPGEVVVNGMSPARRNSKYANSGIVVTIDDNSIGKTYGDSPLRNMYYQRDIEQQAFIHAGSTLAAPAQRLADFVKNKASSTLPESSYEPGMSSVIMDDVLKGSISERLRIAFKHFEKKMHGYLTNDAVILGVESRTSSPVRIPRNKESLEHVSIKRLFPSGEGAGYAGGIVSAAIDGENCATMVGELYFAKAKE